MNMCKAIVQSGPRKGLNCEHPKLDDDGYCSHHQRHKEYDKLTADRKVLCRNFFRGCNSILDSADSKTCETCMEKSKKDKSRCKHADGCRNLCEKESLYCGKHIRDHYRDYEREHGVKICNIERGCFNICKEDYNSCIQCLLNHYIMNDRWFDSSAQNENICIVCEKSYESSSLRDKLKRCEDCVSRLIELQKNKTVKRLYSNSETKKDNKDLHYKEYVKGAVIRNLEMNITQDQFNSIVELPCYYCKTSPALHSITGIDRLDNSKPYTTENVVPCCSICNRMKATMSIEEFVNKCNAIHKYRSNGISYSKSFANKFPSFLSRAVIRYKSYVRNCQLRTKNIKFNLSESDYYNIKKQPCYMCGIQSCLEHTNGIDRKDDSKGYISDNCFPCCGHCNALKFQIPIGIVVGKTAQISNNESLLKYLSPVTAATNTITEINTESFTTNTLLKIFNSEVKSELVKYCTKHSKSDKFIHKISDLFDSRSDYDEFNLRGRIITMMNAEKQQTVSADNAVVHKKAIEVLSMLELGKLNEYISWYESQYDKAHPLFIKELTEFVQSLASLSSNERLAKCKHIMYAQKNRRLACLRRAAAKAVEDLTPSAPPERNRQVQSEEKRQDMAVVKPVEVITERINVPSNIIEHEESVPKQWKSNDIFCFISCGKENYYYNYCKENNKLDEIPDWEARWNALIQTVKSSSFTEAEPVIRTFVEWLRSIRHKALCANKQMDRDDRQVWTSEYIIYLFEAGRIHEYKEYTEGQTGDSDSDPKWKTRWESLLSHLTTHKTDPVEQKTFLGKFLAAQRTKKLRRSRQ
jgi:hypothetical protein